MHNTLYRQRRDTRTPDPDSVTTIIVSAAAAVNTTQANSANDGYSGHVHHNRTQAHQQKEQCFRFIGNLTAQKREIQMASAAEVGMPP